MFDDIFLVFNEYAYQFERDLRITYQLKKNKAIIAQNAGFTYSCIFKIFKDLT